MARLLAELGRPAVLGGDDESDHRARYAGWLAAPELEVFVAEEDGEVVGLIDVELLPRLNFPGPLAWVIGGAGPLAEQRAVHIEPRGHELPIVGPPEHHDFPQITAER